MFVKCSGVVLVYIHLGVEEKIRDSSAYCATVLNI